MSRTATIQRRTNETKIDVTVDLDGTGLYDIHTGIGFFDHMLEQLSRHSLIDLILRCDGDLHIDQHHTTEDVGLAIGQAIAQALGDRQGIARYGEAHAPMDETLTRVVLDISGRPHLTWKSGFTTTRLGEWDTELIEHWFQSFAQTAGITLHVETLYGQNNHHIVESCFKGLARALRQAVTLDPRKAGMVPSTKGTLGGIAALPEGSTLVVNYGAGNLRSAAKALEAAGAINVVVSGEASAVAAASRIVLPGVGAFGQCIGALRAKPGLVAALEQAVHGDGKSFLGICVGMQLLATRGHEHGTYDGLDWIPGEVVRIEPGADHLKVPHMGWNDVRARRPGFVEGSGYFTHSYRLVADDEADVVATADYGGDIAAVVRRGRVTGVQFHPEKSQAYGLAFLRDWLAS